MTRKLMFTFALLLLIIGMGMGTHLMANTRQGRCEPKSYEIKPGNGLPLFQHGILGRGIQPLGTYTCDHTICHYSGNCRQGVNIDEDCLQKSYGGCIPRICLGGYGCATPPYQCVPGTHCVHNQCVPDGGGGGNPPPYAPTSHKTLKK